MRRRCGRFSEAHFVRLQHVLRQRFMGVSLPEHPGAAFWKVQQELSNPFMVAVYVIAMIALCWHFAYGIWLFCAKWGIVTGENARKKLLTVSIAFFFLLAGVGSASLYKLATAPKQPAGESVTEKDFAPAEATK